MKIVMPRYGRRLRVDIEPLLKEAEKDNAATVSLVEKLATEMKRRLQDSIFARICFWKDEHKGGGA